MSDHELENLACHFTWGLQKEDADLNFLEVKVRENLNWSSGGHRKHRELNLLAFIKHLQGFNDVALENFNLAKQEQPDNEKNCIVTYGNLAWIHSIMDNMADSKNYVAKVHGILRAFPSLSPIELHREVQSEKAWSLLRFSRKSYSRAKESFIQALQKEPDDQEWNTGYAFSLFRLEGMEIRKTNRLNFDESPAVIQLKKALTLDPDNAMIRVYLGLKCYKNARNSEAWDYMQDALGMAPHQLSVALLVAKFMKKEKCYDMALKVLKDMLKNAPDSSRLHLEIANNYRWKANQMGAHNPEMLGLCVHHLEKGSNLNPGHIYPQLELALRYAELKETAKADLKFSELFARPDLQPADLQAWHCKYGDFKLYRLGSERVAVEHYKQGMMLQKVSTEWLVCRNRLRKILLRDRRNTYQIQRFFDSIEGDRK